MFNSKQLEDTTEGVSILSWPISKENDSIQCHGLNMKKADNRKNGLIKTIQPIPRTIMAFEFTATIVHMGQSNSDRIGLDSGSKALEYYLNSGNLELNGRRITTSKALAVNDTIRFSLRRLDVDSHTFNLCQININGEPCSTEILLEGKDIYPHVSISKYSPGLEMNTAFSIGNARVNEGMFSVFLIYNLIFFHF